MDFPESVATAVFSARFPYNETSYRRRQKFKYTNPYGWIRRNGFVTPDLYYVFRLNVLTRFFPFGVFRYVVRNLYWILAPELFWVFDKCKTHVLIIWNRWFPIRLQYNNVPFKCLIGLFQNFQFDYGKDFRLIKVDHMKVLIWNRLKFYN